VTAPTDETDLAVPLAVEYKLRRYRKRDLDAVHDIHLKTFAGDPYPKFLFAQFADMLGTGFQVAECGREVVGYVVALLDAGDPQRGSILSLAVHPEHQGRGLEARLTTAADEFLRARHRSTKAAPAGPDETTDESPAGAGKYTVRRYRSDDLAGVHDIELKAFGDDPYPQHLFEELAGVLGTGFFVAVQRHGQRPRVVGYLLAVLDAKRLQRGWVMSVAVHPKHRGHGVGFELMEEAENFFRSRGCTEAVLTVDPENATAVGLYERRHYQEVERHDNHHGLKLPRLVMRQQLAQVLMRQSLLAEEGGGA
jgi:ribosomal-protein-alanine N-acetyltransferase